MPANPFQTAHFQISASQVRQLPEDVGSEVAFAGRSNAGKSSALNAICAQTGLARTSKTPGRTQLLNVFTLDDGRRLIDLPGYGYAKVPIDMRDNWRKLIDAYLRERESLKGVVLIMDSRHPLKDFDRQMLTYCTEIELPCLLLLAKADKLSRSEGTKTLAAVRRECAAQGWTTHMQLFSAHAKTGVDQARAALDSLLNAQPASTSADPT